MHGVRLEHIHLQEYQKLQEAAVAKKKAEESVKKAEEGGGTKGGTNSVK